MLTSSASFFVGDNIVEGLFYAVANGLDFRGLVAGNKFEGDAVPLHRKAAIVDVFHFSPVTFRVFYVCATATFSPT